MIFLWDAKTCGEILAVLRLLSKFSQLVIIQLWEKISAIEKNGHKQDVLCLKSLSHSVKKWILIRFIPF